MEFSYLVSPQYTDDILSRYYINDDTRRKNIRLVNHPTHTPRGIFSWFRNTDLNLKYYGNLYNNNIESNRIYKETGIRL